MYGQLDTDERWEGVGRGWGGRDSRRDPRTGRVRTGQLGAAGSEQLSMLGSRRYFSDGPGLG